MEVSHVDRTTITLFSSRLLSLSILITTFIIVQLTGGVQTQFVHHQNVIVIHVDMVLPINNKISNEKGKSHLSLHDKRVKSYLFKRQISY